MRRLYLLALETDQKSYSGRSVDRERHVRSKNKLLVGTAERKQCSDFVRVCGL